MITASFSTGEKGFCLIVSGHANTAPYGQDLVCAAVSVLVCTLGEALRTAEEAGQLTQLFMRLESGDAKILCKPKAAFEAETAAWFGFAETGLRALAERYSNSIEFRRSL